jgi:hypothetical protein
VGPRRDSRNWPWSFITRTFEPITALNGGRTETNEDLRVDDVELGLQPGRARLDLLGPGLLVDPPLPLRLPLEVLDDVGHVGVAALDPRLLQRLVEDPAGWPDEGVALDVLPVTRLLPDQHQPGTLQPLAEDGLGARLPKWTGPAAGGGLAERLQRRFRRDQSIGPTRLLTCQRELGHTVVLPVVQSRQSEPRSGEYVFTTRSSLAVTRRGQAGPAQDAARQGSAPSTGTPGSTGALRPLRVELSRR